MTISPKSTISTCLIMEGPALLQTHRMSVVPIQESPLWYEPNQHSQHASTWPAHVQLCKALGGSFGFPVDGFLGQTPQANAWDSSWPRFWRQRCERLLRGAVQLRPVFRRVLQTAAFLLCDPHVTHIALCIMCWWLLQHWQSGKIWQDNGTHIITPRKNIHNQ